MLDVGFGIVGGHVGDAVPIFNREREKIAGVTGATWAMEVEGLESGVVERACGKQGEREFPCFSNGGTHAYRRPVCFKLEHLVGCPCSFWIGISTLWLFSFGSEMQGASGQKIGRAGSGATKGML